MPRLQTEVVVLQYGPKISLRAGLAMNISAPLDPALGTQLRATD